MKYLISRFTPNSFIGTMYIISRIKRYRHHPNRVHDIICSIDKIIYKSKNYRKKLIWGYADPKSIPHKGKNGWIVYGYVPPSNDYDNLHSDLLLDFNSDEEALLYFELNIKEKGAVSEV